MVGELLELQKEYHIASSVHCCSNLLSAGTTLRIFTLARLRNHNATDDNKVAYIFKETLHSKLRKLCKGEDLLVQKLLNDMTFD